MTRVVPFFVAFVCLVAAGLQVVLFLPEIVGNRALDVSMWGGAALFRVDGLSVGFGVVWCVSLAVLSFAWAGDEGAGVLPASLMLVGLLGMAYAREPLVLVAGWELAGVGAWLGAGTSSNGERIRLAALIHAPGVPVLVAALTRWLDVFAPPAGGAAREWPVGVALLVGLAVCVRLAGLTYGGWIGSQAASRDGRGLVIMYMICTPFVLAKMLVGGRWDAWGTWTLALIGTLGLLIVTWQGVRGRADGASPVAALAMSSMAGFALAPLSPLAGLGAVLLLALASLVAGLRWDRIPSAYRYALVLAGGMSGLWLVSQGALAARSGLIAAIALSALMLVAAGKKRLEEQVDSNRIAWLGTALVVVLLCVSVVYPQGAVEWLARPAVEAMAGGVGTPVGLIRNWGVGLQVVSPAEVVLASLPSIGMAVAVFLAWVVLYWAKNVATDGGPWTANEIKTQTVSDG